MARCSVRRLMVGKILARRPGIACGELSQAPRRMHEAFHPAARCSDLSALVVADCGMVSRMIDENAATTLASAWMIRSIVFITVIVGSIPCVMACGNNSVTQSSEKTGASGAGGRPATAEPDGSAPSSGADAGKSRALEDASTNCGYVESICAPFDTGKGVGHDCLTTAHHGDEAVCIAILDSCSEGCGNHPIPDAGRAPTDAGGRPTSAPDGGRQPTSAPDAGGDANVPPADAGPPDCRAIGDACALIDPGTGPVHDCTVLRDSTEDECLAQLDQCRNLCGKSLCVRLGSLCHDVDNGPGPIEDCHLTGHAGEAGDPTSIAWCFDNAVHCFDICIAAAGGQP